MNVNSRSFVCDDLFADEDGESIAETVERHAEVMRRTGYDLMEPVTEHAVLVADGRPEFPGSMQVWLKVFNETYVWVDSDGVIHQRMHPTGEDL